MFNFNSWIHIDLFIFLVQMIIVFVFYKKNKKIIGSINAFGLALSGYVFITPLGLFPVAVTVTSRSGEVIRDLFWHFKIIIGMSINDIIILFYLFFIILYSANLLLKRSLFILTFLLALLYILGMLSTLNAPFEIDIKQLLNTTRTFLLIFIGLFLSYRLSRLKNDDWLLKYFLFLTSITILSIISMLLLEADAKGVRYWTHSIIQSQGAVPLFSMILLYLMFSNIFKHLNNVKKLFLFTLPFVIAIGGGVKGMMMVILLLLIAKFLSLLENFKLLLLKSIKNKINLIMIITLLPTTIIAVNYFFFNITAIDTRLFQVLNSMQTLYNQGISSMFFGIGWKQWYIEIIKFPFIDYGAWTPEEIATDGAKSAIQLLPYSLIRSVGLVGFIIMIVIIVKIASSNKQSDITSIKLKKFFIFFFLGADLFAIPDILPEVALFDTIILFSIYFQFINSKLKKRDNTCL